MYEPAAKAKLKNNADGFNATKNGPKARPWMHTKYRLI